MHPEVKDLIKKNEKPGERGKVFFLLFDRNTEILAERLNLEIIFPGTELLSYLDNNLYTNLIAEKAGISCEQNILTKVNSYEHLLLLTSSLGKDLVIQTPYGYSGHNTFLVSSKEDYNKYAVDIEKEKVVKITKRHSNYVHAAIEACATPKGILISPLMLDLTGYEELTPYKAGWYGNEISPSLFGDELKKKAVNLTRKIGYQLLKEGYRGYFELDLLVDNNEELYVKALNPRISGLMNLNINGKHANSSVPLFLFHLMEWMDIPYIIDINSLNEDWSSDEYMGEWTQLMVKHTLDTVELTTDLPTSGIWKMKVDGNIAHHDDATNQNEITEDNQAFFMNIIQNGDYMHEGLNLGVLFVKRRVTDENYRFTKFAKRWINAIRSKYRSEIIDSEQKSFTRLNGKELMTS